LTDTTTSAFVARIFVLRSASKPDITDSAMMGAQVPRNTPPIEMAVNTVKVARSAPANRSRPPTTRTTTAAVLASPRTRAMRNDDVPQAEGP
jgi:hypothetical protein